MGNCASDIWVNPGDVDDLANGCCCSSGGDCASMHCTYNQGRAPWTCQPFGAESPPSASPTSSPPAPSPACDLNACFPCLAFAYCLTAPDANCARAPARCLTSCSACLLPSPPSPSAVPP